MIGAALLAYALSVPASQRFDFTERHMGVEVRVRLYAPDEATARSAARAAFDRVRAWDEALSDWHEDSDAMRLPHHAGDATIVDGRLAQALDASVLAREATGGAFEPSLGALTRVWRQARRERRAPDAATLQAARDASGAGSFQWNPATRRFTAMRDGVRLDFGAIAQGIAADDALRALREGGCAQALVDVSGDIAVGAPPPDADGWRIQIEAEFDDQPTDMLLVHDCGVSTSGDRAQRTMVDGSAASHILDPGTGIPLVAPRQATVVAADATTADVMATALCVLPAETCRSIAAAHHLAARLDRTPAEGGVQPLEGWHVIRRASSCPADAPWAPAAAHPSPASKASDPPCSR